MADAYQTLGIASDPQDALQEMLDDLKTRVPGWNPSVPTYEYALMEVVALQAARIGAAIEANARENFAAYGEEVVLEPWLTEAHAYGAVTFTASHANGLLVQAGTALRGSDGAGGEVVFQTTQDAVINVGDTTAEAVPVEAVDPGRLANPVSGAAVMISAIDGIASVAFDAASSIGADGETIDTYVERLTRRLRLLKAGPVNPDDYDLYLRTSLAAVYRVMVRDGYDPVANTSGNANMLMISMLDSSGAWVGSGVDLEATDLLEEIRETNAAFSIVAPTITTIDVHFDVIVADGYTDADVLAQCEEAVEAFLSPAAWGSPRTGDEPAWLLKPTLRPMGMLGPVIGAVEGVESVEAVTARTGVGSYATTAITLTGDAPLTAPGAVVGTSV